MTEVRSFTNESLVWLRQQVHGTVLTPDHAEYDQVRQGWNLSIDQHPALIVVAADAADVAAGVRFARQEQLGISIQSTGHGIVRAVDNNLLIVTSRMNSVIVDPETQTAWVEAGVIWKQVIEAGQQFGLAPLAGSSPYVGVMGYTLGGGMGWLARKYGLAADSVRSIEIVTPDGELRNASASENSDLFWALRGGGGNFGVVTGMEIDLYPVATIYGGSLTYPVERAGEVLRRFRDWIATVPDELTSSVLLLNFPNVPQLPEPIRGQKFVQIKIGYVGAPEAGAALMQYWLDWAAPIQNSIHEMPFTEVGAISEDPVEPIPSYGNGELFDELSDEAIDLLVRASTAPHSPLAIIDLRHGQGAIATADRSANAIGNRDTLIYMHMAGMTPSPEVRTYVDYYVAQLMQDLHPYISGGMYLNFMNAQAAGARTKDAYAPEAYERLMAVKAQYDPDNRFRYSFNVPVAQGEATPA